jgi:SSS family solute:Na+ symporter
MKYTIFILVLIYEILSVLGVGLWLRLKSAGQPHQEGEFTLAGRQLPLSAVAVTLALTPLGTAHILGQFEMAWFMGAAGMWFSIAHVFLLVFVCLCMGPWVRRMEVTTITEILEQFFGRAVRLVISLVMIGTLFGIITVETQGLGIIFSTMTGWGIRDSALLGGAFGILYVILAGMKEVAWVNLINAVVMYLGLILATLFLAFRLPGGDFHTVSDFYTKSGQSFMLSIYGTPQILLTFGLSTVISVLCCVGFGQGLLQPAMAAKSEKVIKQSLWIAAPINGLFGAFAVVIGLTAKSIPEFAALGPKLAATRMLVEYLPEWLAALLLAAFLGAILSTFAICLLSCATLLNIDFYKGLYKPKVGERESVFVTQALILVLGVSAVAAATSLPPIVPMMNWLFSWSIPVFWIAMFGFFWKRSTKAAVLTLIAAWVANTIWSLTGLPVSLGMPDFPNSYVALAVTLLVGIIAHLIAQGEIGYFRSEKYKAQKEIEE